ncbi:hypothetical protein PATSB16_22130 [Pandoraea thiooxydans]|nr:hypothetical protein PATSB16_22130 [Pandoraea thiooxydans]
MAMPEDRAFGAERIQIQGYRAKFGRRIEGKYGNGRHADIVIAETVTQAFAPLRGDVPGLGDALFIRHTINFN